MHLDKVDGKQQRSSPMTPAVVRLLFASDAEPLAKDLASLFPGQHLHLHPLPPPDHHNNPPPTPSSRLTLVFFSPRLLHFLSQRPLDAFKACGRLDPSSTLALFCCGVAGEGEVACFHRATLNDFASWDKAEEVKGGGFPVEVLDRIRRVVMEEEEEERGVEEVVVVPQVLSKQGGKSIYFIFKYLIKNSKDMEVILKDGKHIDIPLEVVNPYVLKCDVPEDLFGFSHNVKVSLRSKGHVVSEVTVHLSQQEETPPGGEEPPVTVTKQESMLEDHLQFLDSFCPLYRERFLNGLQESTADSNGEFVKLCKGYGLEELRSLISSDSPFAETGKDNGDLDALLGNDCKLPDMDSSNRIDSFLNEEDDMYRLRSTHRSLSLPSTLIPCADTEERDSLHQYIDMSKREMLPHEMLLRSLRSRTAADFRRESNKKKTQSSSSSHIYVSLNLGCVQQRQPERRRAVLRKDLSVSQQELLDIMLDFKEGECTMSGVEREVEQWRTRHSKRDSSLHHHHAKKKSVFAMPWRKKTVQTKTESEPQHNETACPRSILASSSSVSSSDLSHKRFSRCYGNVSYKTVDTLSPSMERPTCPLFPETCPPPLPSRPPPSPVAPLSMRPMPLPRSRLPPSSESSSSKTDSSAAVIQQGNRCPFLFNGEESQSSNTEDFCSNYRLEDLPSFIPPSSKRKSCPSEETIESRRLSIMSSASERNEKQNRNIENLCQKYGFEELGNYVSWLHSGKVPASGKLCSNKDQISKYTQRIIRENHADVRIGLVRRSMSLPSDLQKYETISLNQKNTTEGRQSEQPPLTEHQYNSCTANSSMESNIYMTMIELRHSCGPPALPPDVPLTGSQQELLQIIYAFKRGEKSISQIERQFQDWHARQQTTRQSPPSSSNKKAAFKLPLKGLLWRKAKKKSNDKILDGDKRLSKISFTSNSSMNSDCSDVCRVGKEWGRSEMNGFSSPLCFMPPPLPPRNFAFPLPKNPQKPTPGSPLTGRKGKEKPTPPPKPKMLRKENMSAEMKRKQFEAQAKAGKLSDPQGLTKDAQGSTKDSQGSTKDAQGSTIDAGGGSTTELNNTEDQNKAASGEAERPKSPDYVEPDLPVLLRRNRNKTPSESTNTKRNSKHPPLPSVAPPTTTESPPPAPPPLPPETVQLLVMANLLTPPETSMFYVRRPMSVPSLRQLSKHNTYLELIGRPGGVVALGGEEGAGKEQS